MDKIIGTVRGFAGRSLYGICLLLFISFSGVLSAQTGYSIKFSFSVEDTKGGIVYAESGDIFVCGGKYRLEIPEELIIVCNGKTQWIYNSLNGDIVVSDSEISDRLSSADSPFDSMETLLSLFASSEEEGSRIDVKKDKAGKPVEITLCSDKTVYRVKVKSLETVENMPQEKFIFNVKEYPEAIVTDLR